MRHSCIGIILIIIFIPIFIIVFLVFNARITTLNPDFYLQEFQKTDIYTGVAKSIPKFIKVLAKDQKNAADKKNMENFAKLAGKTIKAEWIKSETENNLENVLNWLNGKSNKLKIEIFLTPLKGEFEKNFFHEFEKVYNSLPKCTNANKSQKELECRPSGMTFSDFQKEFLKTNSDFGQNQFPDKYIYEPKIDKKTPASRYLLSPGGLANSYNIGFYVLIGLCLLILLIIGILARHSMRSLFRWIGASLMVPSFIIFLIALCGRLIFKYANSAFLISNQIQDKSLAAKVDVFSDTLAPAINTIMTDILNRKLIESGVVIGFAILLFIISFFFKSKEQEVAIE